MEDISNLVANAKVHLIQIKRILDAHIDTIQSVLDFRGYENPQFQQNGIGKIGTAGFFLGFVGGFHMCLLTISWFLGLTLKSSIIITSCLIWGLYGTFVVGFHFLEFFITAIKQPNAVCYESFVINQSKSYTTCLLLCSVEFWIETLLFGTYKFGPYMFYTGFTLVVLGQVIRSLAMWTCGESFSHLIQDRRRENHRLIKTGIYSVLRHPSYTGWFYWSIGTQLLLCNPICLCIYAYASWTFFAQRIPYEEETLVEFYNGEYVDYAQSTVIGIPMIPSIHSSSPTVALTRLWTAKAHGT